MTKMENNKISEQRITSLISWKLREMMALRRRDASRASQVVLEGRFPVGCISLRGQPQELAAYICELTDLSLPTVPDTFCQNDIFICCWLRPDEWLLFGDAGSEKVWVEKLMAGINSLQLHAAAVAVGGSYVAFQLSGTKASALLAKGCTLDLHLRSFPAGKCAQSLLARAPILLRRLLPAGGATWEIVVRRSYCEYLCQWLLEAGREFGLDARF